MSSRKFKIQDVRISDLWVEVEVQSDHIPGEGLDKCLKYWGKCGDDKVLDYVTALRKPLLRLVQIYKHPKVVEHQLKGVLAVPSTHGVKVTGLGFLPIAESVEVGEIL